MRILAENAENGEKLYCCNICDYTVKKKITLNKHIKTKHSRNGVTEGMASNRVVFSYFCDECEHGCHNKKSLKKHKAQQLEGHIHQCNLFEKCFKSKKYLDYHVEDMQDVSTKKNYQSVSICTDNTVCDKCLNEDGYLYEGI